MKVHPHPGTGIEITGVDLCHLSDAAFDRIYALFAQHGLLFFRDQTLSETDHIALARRFGPININRFFPHSTQHPEIALVETQPDQRRNIGGAWHTDHSYDLVPALGSLLVARQVPDTGGDTWFVNMSDAWDRLPVRIQQQLETMSAVHSAKLVFGSRGAWVRRLIGAEKLSRNPHLADALDDIVHPAVITHPLSGRRTLYVNPGFTVRFAGWSWLRSAPLLAYLYQHTTRREHVARFRWAPGSVVLWDNRATWHYARHDYRGQRRLMHRITIEGCGLEAGAPSSLSEPA